MRKTRTYTSSMRKYGLGLLSVLLLLAACKAPDDYAIGKEFLSRGDFENALVSFHKAAEKKPSDVRPLKKMATIYARQEKYSEALAILEKAKSLAPQDGEIAVRYAQLLARMGKDREALLAAHEALALPEVEKDSKAKASLEQLIRSLDSSSDVQPSADKKLVGTEERCTSMSSDLKSTTYTPGTELSPCRPLPTPPITRQDLVKLVPDDSPGRILIRWRTETQEDNLGFNIYRSRSPEGPYERINKGLIPGEGSTNIPKDYCFEDKPLPRGEVFYYQIESVSISGVREILEGTKATRVKVKTVEEEREWLWKKVMGAEATSSTAESQHLPKTTSQREQLSSTTVVNVKPVIVTLDSSSSSSVVKDPLY